MVQSPVFTASPHFSVFIFSTSALLMIAFSPISILFLFLFPHLPLFTAIWILLLTAFPVMVLCLNSESLLLLIKQSPCVTRCAQSLGYLFIDGWMIYNAPIIFLLSRLAAKYVKILSIAIPVSIMYIGFEGGELQFLHMNFTFWYVEVCTWKRAYLLCVQLP